MRRVVCWVLSVAMTLGLYAGPASVVFADPVEAEEETHELLAEPIEDPPSDYEVAFSDEDLSEDSDVTEEEPSWPDGSAEIEQDGPLVGESSTDETLSDDPAAEEAVAVESSAEEALPPQDNPLSVVRSSDSIPLTAMAQDSSTITGLKMPAYSIDAKVREGFSGEDRFAFITEDNVLYTSFSFVGGEEDEESFLTRIPNVAKFASARGETGVITTDGDLYVWVHPSEWSSSDTYLPRDAPMQQVMPGTKFTQYATSNGQSFAIDSEGNLWGWGDNECGDLGNGGTQDVDVSDPVRILPGVKFSDVASCGGNGPTEEHCAVTTSGKVYAWGQCYEPSVFTEGSSVRYIPTEVPIPATVVDVEVGITHYGALDSSGGLWMWGEGGGGQLGVLQDEDGENPGEPYPTLETPALTMTNVVQFSLGDWYSSAVTRDGVAYGWGWNQDSQSVFESDAGNVHLPTKALDNVVQVSCGTGVTFAVKKNGSLWRWGDEFWFDENPPHLLVGSDDSAVHVSGEVDATLYTTLDKSYKHEITHTFAWDDDWMLGDSTTYNPKLSIASMVLAWAAYDDTPANGYRYITKTLKALGMGDIYTASYANRIHNEDAGYSQSIDRVAYSFSHRKTIDGEGNGIDLVFVVVRGTPGNIEWNSNANVADGTNDGIDPMFHEGFKAAEQEIFRNLAVYFNKHEIDDATARILITGHSRGAAVANLLAADLQNQTSTEYTQDVTKDQVFAYTFATPAATMDAQAHSAAYANIFNIVNPEDFVPRVPLKAWGFERYGTTYYLPSKSTESAKFYDNIDDLQDTYCDLCGLSYHPYASGAGATNSMVQDSESVAHNVNEFYANSVPKSLISALQDDQFRRWQTFRDFFGNLTTFLGTGQILPVLEDGVSSTLYGRYGNIFSFFVYNSKITDCIAHAHTKETYLGWLEVLDEAAVSLLPYGGRNDTGKLTTYCPVALRVLDGDGDWVGSISVTGQVSTFEESPVALMYDEVTDGKTVWLPTWGGYTVEIIPYNSGSMDVTWSECDAEGEESQTVCFNDVPIEPMGSYEFSAELSDEEQPIIEAATLIGPDEQEIDPTYVVDTEDSGKWIDIAVSASGNGTATGPASSLMGEHVFVSAVPDEGYAFRGWYEFGKLVEDAEATYAFRAEGNRNLEARFSLIQAEGIDMRTELELSVGDRVNLWADVIPWEAADFPITYTSSNERVATVDAEGNVTAIAGGTATITACTPRVFGGSDYVEETCSVKVTGDSGQVNPFRDVSEKTPHYEDILWLADAGISAGWAEKDGTRTFRPTNTVVRQDMAAFLFRLAKLWGLVDDSWQPTGSVTFTDVNASTPHYREIMWLAESGISAGWKVGSGREFRPRNTVVRQDMAAFLRRLQALRDPSVKTWKPTGASPFRDVTSSTPHSEDILWLAESGVSAGWKVGDTKEFRPTNTVIRQDMAAFLHRLDGLG